MELFYLIGFYVFVVLIAVLVKGIKQLIEERRYKRKLLELAPQIETIDVEELSLQLNNNEKKYSEKTLKENHSLIIDSIKNASFNIISDRKDFSEINKYKGQKVFVSELLKKDLQYKDESMPYKIDDVRNSVSLSEYTRMGIDFLDNPKGFFMMIEGGKIDWACHDKDAGTTIHDVIAFNDAVAEAVEFYKKHPDETLIIVTADHETGGMALGYEKTAYNLHLEVLQNQKISGESFKDTLAIYPGEKYSELIEKYFGIKEFIIWPSDNDHTIVNDVLGQINSKAGVGWTTHAHSACPVGTYVLGDKKGLFISLIDNTDIMKNIMILTEMNEE